MQLRTCHNTVLMIPNDLMNQMAQKLTGINSKPTLNHCPSASHKFLPSDHEAFFLFSFVFYQLVQYYVLPGRNTISRMLLTKVKQIQDFLLQQHQTLKQKQQHTKMGYSRENTPPPPKQMVNWKFLQEGGGRGVDSSGNPGRRGFRTEKFFLRRSFF